MEVGAEHGEARGSEAEVVGERGLRGLGEIDFVGFFLEARMQAVRFVLVELGRMAISK
jgi:hypothetical protein